MNVSKMEQSARAASSFLKTVANEHRLLILCHLARGEMRVGDLEERLGMRQPHLSQHLARLRRDGLVRMRRSGREIFYTIGSLEALRVIGLLYEMFCADGTSDRTRSERTVRTRARRVAAETAIPRRKAKAGQVAAEVK
jgi:DNA-binding transcriptional ArsR family regulator